MMAKEEAALRGSLRVNPKGFTALPATPPGTHPRYYYAEFVQNLLTGMEERGAASTCKVLIPGFLGAAETAAVLIDFVRRAKARNPKLLYLRDPIMGAAGPGFYVSPDHRARVSRALSLWRTFLRQAS
jgi:pyridoxal/pyridoxine/pyridoxamine kinase